MGLFSVVMVKSKGQMCLKEASWKISKARKHQLTARNT
jgi:hypothetical protein